MSSPQTIVQRDYSQGRAIIDVRVAVINQENHRQVTFSGRRIKIDTGFDAGFHIRESEMSQLATIGIRPVVGPVTLAGNMPATARFCFGYLQKIGDHELPAPGVEITIVFQGTNPEGLLGLEAIGNWVVTFNGPSQSFTIDRP